MSVAVEWSRQALIDLLEIRRYSSRDKPEAAERLAMRLVALAEVLRDYPQFGHPEGWRDLRRLPVGGTPYRLIYRTELGRVRILAVPRRRRAE